MELQINQFWILKGHNMINSVNEFELDVLNTYYATRAWKLKILQRMYQLISTFSTQRFCGIWKSIFLEYYTERAKYFHLHLISLALKPPGVNLYLRRFFFT